MTWPTDLTRRSTNPFSPENMITRNLTDQALRAAQSEREKLLKRRCSSSSESDDDMKSQAIQTRLAVKKSSSVYKSLSTRNMKTLSSRESSFSLKNFLLHLFCCVR